ncbi:MAG: YfhO family protein, partial [Thermomicrobium sp.]|nr:YfhO family protein [Thermomicrobium sp.]
ATEFALRPIALLTFVLPRLWGDDPTDWWGPWASGEVWAYAGIVTLLLAGIGLSLGREPLRWGLAGIGLLALLHALGPETPVHGWVYRFLPFADLLRAPARTLLFVDLVLALLAGIGLAVVTDAARAERPLLRTVERSLVVVVAALALLVTPLFLLPIIASATPPERTVIALEGAVLALLWLALALVWLRTSRTRRLGTPSALAGLALLTVDLFSATAPFNPTPDDVLVDFRHPTVVETVRTASERDGPWRLLSLTIRWQPSAAAVHGLEDAGGLFDPMQPAAYAKALDCARSAPDRPLVDLLNVRFLLARADSGSPGSRYRRQALTPDGLAVWENPEALPRAWLAGRATLASPREALDRLCHPDFDPRQELLLAGSLPPADPAASGSARATWDGPNRFQVRVRASAPAYLVVAVTADPGWRAFVDGEPVDIALADGIYQVIWVPAGQHTVVFEYRPPYLGWGSLAAGLAASLLLLASLGRAVVSRRSRTPPSKPSATVNVLLDHAARPAGHDVRDVSVTLRSPEPVSAVTSAP